MNTPFRKRSIHALALVFIMLVASSAHSQLRRLSGETMGTYYSIGIHNAPADFDREQVVDKLEARLTEINRQMSTWIETSEISRFNNSDSVEWQPVSKEFAVVTAEAKRIFELTEGAFDPTVERLIRLWGFGDRRERTVPADDEIQAALKTCGMSHLSVRIAPPAIRKDTPGLQINLSAIAKGFAVDELYSLLAELGFSECVVDIGGENFAGKQKGGEQPWKLGIESPVEGVRRVLHLSNQAIATSGDYRNFFCVDGVTYSHAINPTTGRPVRNPPAAVTVVAESCMTADALATAMMVMGTERGQVLAEANDIPVYFQQIKNDGSIEESRTSKFVDIAQVERPLDVERVDSFKRRWVRTHFAQAAESEASETPVVGGEDSDSEADSSGGTQDNFRHVSDEPAAGSSALWFPFVAAAAIFLVAVAGMAIGTMLQNKSIKGSCGGLASMPGSETQSICDLCTIPKDECTNAELKAQMQAAAEKQSATET